MKKAAEETTKESVNKNSFKASRTILHQAFPLPMGGGVTTSLYADKGVEMHYTPEGLFCIYKNSKFVIPLANVVGSYI